MKEINLFNYLIVVYVVLKIISLIRLKCYNIWTYVYIGLVFYASSRIFHSHGGRQHYGGAEIGQCSRETHDNQQVAKGLPASGRTGRLELIENGLLSDSYVIAHRQLANRLVEKT